MTAHHSKAQQFLDHEQAFRLGALPTEQPHPRTEGLADTLRADTAAGLAMLQSVDRDLVPVARQVIGSADFNTLVDAMAQAFTAGRRVFFTGCGATGRLSILLEAMWRRYWHAQDAPSAAKRADQVRSVMAGGDFALIRSVEGFEDFTAFGRRQLRETGVAAGDVVVAITEGGETSFVIGTAWEGLDVGATTFFVYNNPSDVLTRHVQRSREVIQDPRITKLDLASGPMAVAGSTRMQATTIELLVVGAALEAALARVLDADSAPLDTVASQFERLLTQLEEAPNVAVVADLTETEETIYRAHGLVTYFADACLLDILTDTTERSPTFSLPPFRERQDEAAPVSWSFVKTPLCATEEAWSRMLGRPPRGVDWDAATYRGMQAPDTLRDDPPVLTRQRILRFGIGNEPDPSRTEAPSTLAVALLAGEELRAHTACDHPFRTGFHQHAPAYDHALLLAIGPDAPPAGLGERTCHVRCDLPPTRLDLWPRVAAKLVLNTLSTATMGRIGRLVSNWMVYVNTSNKKLIDRGVRLIADQAEVDYNHACSELFATLEEMPAVSAGSRAQSPVAATIDRLKAQAVR